MANKIIKLKKGSLNKYFSSDKVVVLRVQNNEYVKNEILEIQELNSLVVVSVRIVAIFYDEEYEISHDNAILFLSKINQINIEQNV